MAVIITGTVKKAAAAPYRAPAAHAATDVMEPAPDTAGFISRIWGCGRAKRWK
jgi:hypothetical protein